MGKQRFLGMKAMGLIQFGSNTLVDGETIVIGNKTYEFDDDDSVTSGNVLVDIKGTAALTAAELIAKINANKPTPGVTAHVDTLDDTKVRLIADSRGVAGNMTVSDTVSDAGVTVHSLIGGEAGGTQTEARGSYTVLQDDIDGTPSLEIETGLTSPRFFLIQVYSSAGVYKSTLSGAWTISGSKLKYDFGGATDPVAGDVVTFHCWE